MRIICYFFFTILLISCSNDKKQPQVIIDGVTISPLSKPMSKWVNYYYKSPTPNEIPSAIYAVSKTGSFKDRASTPPLVSFFSILFKQNKNALPTYLKVINSLDQKDKQMFYIALAYSNTAEAKAELKKMIDNGRFYENIYYNKSPEIHEIQLASIDVINMLWGAYFASGKKMYIIRIIKALSLNGSEENIKIASFAEYTLKNYCPMFPETLNICKDCLKEQPEKIKKKLTAIIQSAESKIKK